MSADFTDIPFIQQTFFGGLLGSRPSLTINNKERMKKIAISKLSIVGDCLLQIASVF
jgi:hypothetical protein